MLMVKEMAKELIKLYSTRDPFELCRYFNIKIMFSNLGKEINGFFQKTSNDLTIIHINSSLSEDDQKYICAHELAHALLHENLSLSIFIDNKLQVENKYEIQADRFAAELLIEDTLNQEEYVGFNIDQICTCLGIPKKLMKYKFNLDI